MSAVDTPQYNAPTVTEALQKRYNANILLASHAAFVLAGQRSARFRSNEISPLYERDCPHQKRPDSVAAESGLFFGSSQWLTNTDKALARGRVVRSTSNTRPSIRDGWRVVIGEPFRASGYRAGELRTGRNIRPETCSCSTNGTRERSEGYVRRTTDYCGSAEGRSAATLLQGAVGSSGILTGQPRTSREGKRRPPRSRGLRLLNLFAPYSFHAIQTGRRPDPNPAGIVSRDTAATGAAMRGESVKTFRVPFNFDVQPAANSQPSASDTTVQCDSASLCTFIPSNWGECAHTVSTNQNDKTPMTDRIKLEGVREYGEGDPVEIATSEDGRLCLVASVDAGYNSTAIDLVDLITWLKANRPELLT